MATNGRPMDRAHCRRSRNQHNRLGTDGPSAGESSNLCRGSPKRDPRSALRGAPTARRRTRRPRRRIHAEPPTNINKKWMDVGPSSPNGSQPDSPVGRSRRIRTFDRAALQGYLIARSARRLGSQLGQRSPVKRPGVVFLPRCRCLRVLLQSPVRASRDRRMSVGVPRVCRMVSATQHPSARRLELRPRRHCARWPSGTGTEQGLGRAELFGRLRQAVRLRVMQRKASTTRSRGLQCPQVGS